jgi:hypothetical protein
MSRLASILLAGLLSAGPAYAEAPLPQGQQKANSARKSDIALRPAHPSDLTGPAEETETVPPDPACARVLASNRIVAASAPPVSGPDGCGVATPVKLGAVVLPDGRHILLEPPPLIRCSLAEVLGDWIRDDVAPIAQNAGGLAKILASEGYECRPRNRIAGAKLSEHGKGNALDLRGFVLRNGQTVTVERPSEARDFMRQLKTTACARFTTVLGPGSDSFHKTHLHVDLAERHNNYRICQWEIE